jgi:hypothetical protein
MSDSVIKKMTPQPPNRWLYGGPMLRNYIRYIKSLTFGDVSMQEDLANLSDDASSELDELEADSKALQAVKKYIAWLRLRQDDEYDYWAQKFENCINAAKEKEVNGV